MSWLGAFFAPAMRWRAQDWLALLFIVAAGAIFVSQCLWVGDARIDDAYITFSFAKNLALGNGPVYSHGVRVEGYSTFLWMVLVALPLLVTRGAAPLAAARIVGAPFAALLGWSVYRLARACGASRLTAALCVFLLSFNTDLAVGYLTGMETLAYVAVVAFAFAATARSFEEMRWRKWAAWACLTVALMRIDGFVPAGFLFGCLFLREIRPSNPRGFWKFLRFCGPPIAVYALWFAWRWHYYGMFLPSTYYAKELIPQLLPSRGLDYVINEMTSAWLWLGLVGWVWLLWRRRLTAALSGCYVVGHLLYVVKVGGDWMSFGRFVLPVVPLLVVLTVVAAMDMVATAFRARTGLRWLAPVAPLAAGCLMAGHMDHRYFNDGLEGSKVAGVADQTNNVMSYLRAAEFLRQVVPSGARLVTDYGGVFACYTDGALIEMWGLANATIATRGNTEGVQPIYGKTCAACYPELQPEYFHVMQPMVRKDSPTERAFTSTEDVIANVWQTNTIGRYIDFKATFAAGRIYRPATNEALYFLRKRDASFSPASKATATGFVVDYPFEQAGEARVPAQASTL